MVSNTIQCGFESHPGHERLAVPCYAVHPLVMLAQGDDLLEPRDQCERPVAAAPQAP